MTRRELTDPFGSDDEDEPPPFDNKVMNNKIPETNGDVLRSVDASDTVEKREDDVFSDLPKPNPVSYTLIITCFDVL